MPRESQYGVFDTDIIIYISINIFLIMFETFASELMDIVGNMFDDF